MAVHNKKSILRAKVSLTKIDLRGVYERNSI